MEHLSPNQGSHRKYARGGVAELNELKVRSTLARNSTGRAGALSVFAEHLHVCVLSSSHVNTIFNNNTSVIVIPFRIIIIPYSG